MRDRTHEVSVDLHYDLGDLLTLENTDRSSDMYVSRPDHRPLSTAEEHAALRFATDDGVVVVALDGEALDALVDELYDIQRFHAEGDSGFESSGAEGDTSGGDSE